MLFGLLHCVDNKKPMTKAKALYCLLQDGGLEAHAQISSSDKDLAPLFESLCLLVTNDLFDAASSVDGVDKPYGDDVCESLKEQIETVREDNWLEDVYGAQSRLLNEDWLEKVCTDGAWVFDPEQLRTKIFEAASVEQIQ